MKLVRRLLVGGLLLGLAVLVANSWPDVARYLKMREM
jgi:hypothetical protein